MKKILINETPWQTRVAITRDNDLQNIYFWSHTSENLERSFYKAVVTKILPGIQTAFVDIGQDRAGFLHISEIDRELAIDRMAETDLIDTDDKEKPKEKTELTRSNLDISKILTEKEHILVQVSKEPVNEKGAKLTTCFTLPGRFIVLMPNIPRIGISKKIESKEERQRLKDLLLAHLPQGMGAIIRTSSESYNSNEIIQDLGYLLDTWNKILKKYSEANPKEKIYEDIDIVLQAVRDNLDSSVEYIITDNKATENKIYNFIKIIAPEEVNKIRYYNDSVSLFEKYGIEKQIDQALQRKVFLKSGGSIIIETTEAMTVVDVNTGRYTGQTNLEETIFKTNLEAAEEITRQLRLRNIGGLIVIDFIDMANSNNKQKLYRYFEKNLREKDKFQSVVLKVSEFGLVQMTRKRSGKTLQQQLTHKCPTCQGIGFIKSLSNEAFTILRKISSHLESKASELYSKNLVINLAPDIFHYITHIEYNSVLFLEKLYKCKIILVSQDSLSSSSFSVEQENQ